MTFENWEAFSFSFSFFFLRKFALCSPGNQSKSEIWTKVIRNVEKTAINISVKMNELYLGRKHCQITQTSQCNILRSFSAVKNGNFQKKKKEDFFSYFCSKYRLLVHEAVLTSTHNLCFRAKVKKNVYPLRGSSLYGHVILMNFHLSHFKSMENKTIIATRVLHQKYRLRAASY